MDRFAVLSDVNANLEALTAVLQDVQTQGIRDLIFLGDAVGYGPDPIECLSRLRAEVRVYLCGRLEYSMIHNRESELALAESRMLSHTREILRSDSRHWDWLCCRSFTYTENGFAAASVNPRGPDHECLILENILHGVPSISALFSEFQRLLFVGGNHQPWIFTDKNIGLTDKETGFEHKLSGTGKFIVSVGSVGQPRDGDPRACYAIASDESVIWRRVEYEIDRTMSKIEASPVLNRHYAMRLRDGI